MRTIATIGAYGWNRERFIEALTRRDVSLVVDVRQRRGVRGAEYAWANSIRLQAALAAARISYQHRPEMAPTTELRHLQYAEDERLGVGKRKRLELAAEYRRRYLAEILDRVDLEAFVMGLPQDSPAALLCVERYAQACHRSLIAARLEERHGVKVIYI
ncbi:MAG: DUF488 family protein [Candidatus Dormibacteria bacterium]